MAVAACLLGYGEVGLWLKKEASKPSTWVVTKGNPYARWMDDYGGEHYQNAVKIGIRKLSIDIVAFQITDIPSQKPLRRWLPPIRHHPQGMQSGARSGRDVHVWRRISGIWRWDYYDGGRSYQKEINAVVIRVQKQECTYCVIFTGVIQWADG